MPFMFGGPYGEGEDLPLSRAQVRTAWALARAHGHEWAMWDDMVRFLAAVEDGEQTAAAIGAVGEQLRGEDAGALGITGPTAEIDSDGRPVIVHTTGTGRLSWSVYHDGSVSVEIHRPTPPYVVLRLHVGALPPDPEGGDNPPWYAPGWEWRSEHRDVHISQVGPAGLRHLSAIARVVRAIEEGDLGRLDQLAAQTTPVGAGQATQEDA